MDANRPGQPAEASVVCMLNFLHSEFFFFSNGFILDRRVKSCQSDVRWAQPSNNKWQRRLLPSCHLSHQHCVFNLKQSLRKQKNRRTCEKIGPRLLQPDVRWMPSDQGNRQRQLLFACQTFRIQSFFLQQWFHPGQKGQVMSI